MGRVWVGVLVAVAVASGWASGAVTGVGVQFTVPAVFGVSGRQWASPDGGFEGDVFVLTTGDELWGAVGARVLGRLAQPEPVGFYLVGGGSLYLPGCDWGLGLCGGIDFFPPFAPNPGLNVEFGFMWHREARLGMAFGVGLHYYYAK